MQQKSPVIPRQCGQATVMITSILAHPILSSAGEQFGIKKLHTNTARVPQVSSRAWCTRRIVQPTGGSKSTRYSIQATKKGTQQGFSVQGCTVRTLLHSRTRLMQRGQDRQTSCWTLLPIIVWRYYSLLCDLLRTCQGLRRVSYQSDDYFQ